MADIKGMTIRSAAEALASGKESSASLCQAFLARIASLEPSVKAFLSVNAEEALAQAKDSDARRAAGKALSPWDGVPVTLKDNIAATGFQCSCASKIFGSFKSPYDATVVARLKEKGFVLLGRANMDEFAMGSSCENSAFQKTANPWDLSRVPGGSSGGSAAAVAASETVAALGSDTGGSIRQPAAFCGVVGLKPTYGRVSRYGLVAFASSLDQIGPISKDVYDAAVLLDVIGGHDKADCTSLPSPCGGFADAVAKVSSSPSLKGLKIGLPKEYFEIDALAPGMKAVVSSAIESFKRMGVETVEVSLPHTKYAVACYYIIATAEASANLARFDGIRYGARAMDAQDIISTYLETRKNGFGDEVVRRIILGTYVLSSGYYDAYYLRAQKVRSLIRRDFADAFKVCDLILTPVTPSVAFKFGEKSDPLQMYLSDIFTIALNLSGNCGISVPAGIDQASGMPAGIQLIAKEMDEERLLCSARAFELARDVKEFIPKL